MIDLSFELGRPLHELAATMPENDIRLYQHYAQRRNLPQRRLELLLAQVALSLFQVNGAKEVSLADFLFDPPEDFDDPESLDPEIASQSAADAFGFKPRNLKKPTY